MDAPEGLLFSKEHEWVRLGADGQATLGITDHAQSELGDVVYVDLPEVGASFESGNPIGSLESVKAVSEVYTPISGDVTEVNKALEESPDLINTDPYGAGWIFKIKPRDESELGGLMSAQAYDEFVKSEAGG